MPLISFIKQEATPLKAALFISIILLTGNLSAIVDSMLHPEIPYFDAEHLIIGSAYALLACILFFSIGVYNAKRKLEENLLRESEELYRNIFDSARDIVFTVNKDTLITSLNPAFEKITGWSREEWLGKSFAPILHPDDLQKAVGVLQKIMQGEMVETFELRALKKSGEYFTGEFTVAPIGYGETVAALGHIRDITERKKMEEELEIKVEERTSQLMKAQEELSRKKRLEILGQLAGGVGHELRNPLGVISNAVYFLKTVLPDADETVKEYLNIIKDEVDNAKRIISDLLNLSCTITPQPKAISVHELVCPILVKCVIPENVTVQIELPETLHDVLADPHQMGQVFQNLITNALQAMPEGGILQIRAEEDPASRTVKISVMDSGKGISPENIEMLFQPLFTTKARGIGLGLAISRRFVEANRGRLEVESREGKGATFTVTLPVADEMNLPAAKTAGYPKAFPHLTGGD